jgi:hypothetical protein
LNEGHKRRNADFSVDASSGSPSFLRDGICEVKK